MLHEEIGVITHMKDLRGTLLLTHTHAKDCDKKESAIAWTKILNEVRKIHPDKMYQFIPHSYFEKNNQGQTARYQILESMIAIPM